MQKSHFIIDGYNIIHAFKDFDIETADFAEARQRLTDLVLEYGAYGGYKVTLVFDAFLTEESLHVEKVNEDFFVVFTGKNETADSYIERLVYEEIKKGGTIYVVTSDKAEQMTVLGTGAYRLSTREFLEGLRRFKTRLREKEKLLRLKARGKTRVYECLSEETTSILEKWRRS